MGHEIFAFLSYYFCAFVIHGVVHLKRVKHDPTWIMKPRLHKAAAVGASVGVAAGQESIQGYAVHLLVYSGLIPF